MNYIIAVIPLLLGFAIDAVLGDPYTLPHPIRLIGRLISQLENSIRKNMSTRLRAGGVVLALSVLIISTVIPLLLLIICYRVNLWFGAIAEGIMCYYLIAARCLKDESMKVYRAIESDNTEEARRAVSMIVGRDTACLDEKGIICAAVETVAENTSDGVTAPVMYMGIGGAALGFFYKAANTMDSMIGYKNEKYADIGRFAAKLDDVLNYFPSRITALVMIASSYFLRLDTKNAYRIWKRDRRRHASPNSAQTESVCAGALNVRLAGDAYYFRELHKKEYIGDAGREIENEDIRRTNRIMYVTSSILLVMSVILRAIVFGGMIIC